MFTGNSFGCVQAKVFQLELLSIGALEVVQLQHIQEAFERCGDLGIFRHL
jgi:hypothetical protein